MTVQLSPALEKELSDLAARTGRDRERLFEEAVSQYARGTGLDWSQCSEVGSVPGRVSGAWVFKNTRMPVSVVFEDLEAGATIDEIVEWFDVTHGQVLAVLDFAARSLAAPARWSASEAERRHVDRVLLAIKAAAPASFLEDQIPD